MPKVYLDRIRKRTGYHNETLEEFMDKLIQTQNETIAAKIAKLSKDHYEDVLDKYSGPNRKKFVLPSVGEVLPKQSVFIKKAAQDGKLIRDTLRDKLTRDLRDALSEHTKSGEQKMVYSKGKAKGRINRTLISKFEKAIAGTFEGYVKRNPKLGYPTNIHNIAVTEIRTTINQIKSDYVARLQRKNPEIVVGKIWRHNPIADVPRHGHLEVSGQIKEADQKFKVPVYKKRGRNWIKVRTDYMARPHDPDAKPDQIIGCNCDIEYKVRVKGSRKIRKDLVVEAVLAGIAVQQFGASADSAQRIAKAIIARASFPGQLVQKNAALPIGHISTYRDGTREQKVGPGDWKELTDAKPAMGNPIAEKPAGSTQREDPMAESMKIDPTKISKEKVKDADHFEIYYDGYNLINEYLETGKVNQKLLEQFKKKNVFNLQHEPEKIVKETALVLQKLSATEKCHYSYLYRGTGLTQVELSEYTPGQTVSMKKLSATTNDLSQAYTFAMGNSKYNPDEEAHKDKEPVLIEFIGGESGLRAHDTTRPEYFDESLLAKGGEYEVVTNEEKTKIMNQNNNIPLTTGEPMRVITLKQKSAVQKAEKKIVELVLEWMPPRPKRLTDKSE